LTAAEKPVCACYATIGPPVVGLCCACETDAPTTTGEATVHVEQIYDADPNTLEQISRIHPCNRSVVAADLTIVVTRCYPMVDEGGNMPPTDDQDEAALSMHDDLTTVWQALTCGCSDVRLTVRNVAVDAMPDAGCAVLVARLTAEVRL
jgi:hypothetical protein